YSFFPFLRRYQPALPFPLLFVFCVFIWRAIRTKSNRIAASWAVGAGMIIAALIFSYFYLWTAALAWLAGCALIYFVWMRESRTRVVLVSAIAIAFAVIALVP